MKVVISILYYLEIMANLRRKMYVVIFSYNIVPFE